MRSGATTWGRRLVDVAALVVPAAFLALALAFPVAAHFDGSDRYTHTGCPASSANRVDPLNVLFRAWGTYGRALAQVQSHAGWADDGGSAQYFVDHASCSLMHGQRASAGMLRSRFHVRVRGQHEDPSLGWTATGDAHHEDLVLTCGHAVDSNGPGGSGFDQGRNELRAAMAAAGHAITTGNWWGNTQNFKQCDGDLAGSNGYTTYITLHQVNH
jgi:hypothetical protein